MREHPSPGENRTSHPFIPFVSFFVGSLFNCSLKGICRTWNILLHDVEVSSCLPSPEPNHLSASPLHIVQELGSSPSHVAVTADEVEPLIPPRHPRGSSASWCCAYHSDHLSHGSEVAMSCGTVGDGGVEERHWLQIDQNVPWSRSWYKIS